MGDAFIKIPLEDVADVTVTQLAEQEASLIAEGNLRKIERREEIRKELHRAAIIGLRVILAVVLIISAVWLFHLISPRWMHFLEDDQRSTLQNILISVLGAKALSETGKRWLDQAMD